MFHNNKRRLLLFSGLVILLVLCEIFIEYVHYKENGVDTTVFKPWAYLVQDGEKYFIVGKFDKYDRGGDETYYYLKDNRKIPVRITGNSPYHAIDIRFWNKTCFLVHGSIDQEMTEYFGVDIIDAKEWKMLSPINRESSLSKRYFAPFWYIDTKDVENGGYQKCDETMRGIYYWEEEWLRHKWENEYIILTLEYIGEGVQWYRMKEGVKYPIIVDGNVPEKSEEGEVRFIARGTWDENVSTFIIEEWRNTNRASWKYSHLEY